MIALPVTPDPAADPITCDWALANGFVPLIDHGVLRRELLRDAHSRLVLQLEACDIADGGPPYHVSLLCFSAPDWISSPDLIPLSVRPEPWTRQSLCELVYLLTGQQLLTPDVTPCE